MPVREAVSCSPTRDRSISPIGALVDGRPGRGEVVVGTDRSCRERQQVARGPPRHAGRHRCASSPRARARRAVAFGRCGLSQGVTRRTRNQHQLANPRGAAALDDALDRAGWVPSRCAQDAEVCGQGRSDVRHVRRSRAERRWRASARTEHEPMSAEHAFEMLSTRSRPHARLAAACSIAAAVPCSPRSRWLARRTSRGSTSPHGARGTAHCGNRARPPASGPFLTATLPSMPSASR